jgi:hypothetical protein
MKKIALAGLIVVAASLIAVPFSDAGSPRRGGFHHHPHFHSRVFIGVGPGFWYAPYPYWYYPAPYAVYAPPPSVVVQEAPQPPVYIQQQQAGPVMPPPGVGASPEQFWYYCQSSQGYFPAVSSCPEAWIKVAPRP